MDSLVRRLEGGLTTLAKAQEDTEALKIELAMKNEIIAEKTIVVNEMIDDITKKSNVASIQQKDAAEKEEYLSKESVVIAREEAEANKAEAEAIPALEAAKEALKNV
jgi:dynein heavy chain